MEKGQQGGWLSPQARKITVTGNSEGDSGYRGGTRYKTAARNKKVEEQNEEQKRRQKMEKELANRASTSEIDENGRPRVIGMSGQDPLLGTLAETYVGGKLFNGALKVGKWGMDKFRYYLPFKPMTTEITPQIELVQKATSKPVTGKVLDFNTAVRIQQEEGKKNTQNILDFLGKNKIDFMNGQFRDPKVKEYAELLKGWGVDVSRFSEVDLQRIMAERSRLISQSGPVGNHFVINRDDRLPQLIRFTGRSGLDQIGDLSLRESGNYYKPSMIWVNSTSEGGFSEGAYNAAIDYAHQIGKRGLISGENLISPEKTYSVWKHYPRKKLVGNYGEHVFENGQTISEGPVYALEENSGRILAPYKHASYVHPSMMSKSGMQPPQWNIRDAFRIAVPITIGTNYLDNKK